MKVFQTAILLTLLSGARGFAHSAGSRVGTGLDMSAGEGMTRRSSLLSFAAASVLLSQAPQPAFARLESVNRPDLLPAEKGLNVIQVEKFLTSGQAKRMDGMLTSLEKETGFRVRVLCQNYPNTPGLAIRDYWDLAKEVRLVLSLTL
jgi:hypothetical protein